MHTTTLDTQSREIIARLLEDKIESYAEMNDRHQLRYGATSKVYDHYLALYRHALAQFQQLEGT